MMRTVAIRIIGVLLLLTSWQIASSGGLLDNALFPTPVEVFRAFGVLFGDRWVGGDLAATLARVATAMAWAILFGVPAGLLLGAINILDELFGGIVDFFRSLPATALFPVFILFFGMTEAAKIGVTAFSSGLVILIGTVHGVRQIRPVRREAAIAAGASGFRLFRSVILPASAPEISLSIRTALSIALIVVIVTEMFAGTLSGLGWRIFYARETFRIPELYALLILTGALGAGLSRSLKELEMRLIHWSGH